MGIDQMECIRRGLDYNTELRRVHAAAKEAEAIKHAPLAAKKFAKPQQREKITELRPCPRQPTAPGYLDPYNLTDEQRQSIAEALHQLHAGYYEVLAEGGSLFYVASGVPLSKQDK